MKNATRQQSGFALLITIIVVAAVISIGLSILDLSIKQVRLSTNAKQSEVAFHAANAGVECASYWRRTAAAEMEAGDAFDPTCFEDSIPAVNIESPPDTIPITTGDGEAHLYRYKFTWPPTGSQRCTEIDTLVMAPAALNPSASAPDPLVVNNMQDMFPGYEEPEKDCDPGTKCTVIATRGYNRPCSNISTYGTVQREVLLEF